MNNETKIKLQQEAIEISYKTGKMVMWTDLIRYMIDNYTKMAKNDMIEKL